MNLQVLTDKTTDYHSHLLEFELPDTTNWHTIRMTTHGFKAAASDTLIAHLALMDWGLEKYRVDVDYVNVAIVEAGKARRPGRRRPLPPTHRRSARVCRERGRGPRRHPRYGEPRGEPE